jgi:hypothetical protein
MTHNNFVSTGGVRFNVQLNGPSEIENNIFQQTALYITYKYCTSISFRYNTVNDMKNQGFGILFTKFSPNTENCLVLDFANNLLSNMTSNTLLIIDANNAIVTNNIFQENQMDAIVNYSGDLSISMPYNYWGVEKEKIRSYIRDSSISKDNGYVSFSPFFVEPDITGEKAVEETQSFNIDGDVLWKSDSAIVVNSTLFIPQGSTLTIAGGTLVQFAESIGVVVEGTLKIMGESGNIVQLSSSKPGANFWSGIRFSSRAVPTTVDQDGNYLSGSVISYTVIRDIQDLSLADIQIETSTIKFENSVIHSQYATSFSGPGSVNISNSEVHCVGTCVTTTNAIIAASSLYGATILSGQTKLSVSNSHLEASNSAIIVPKDFTSVDIIGNEIINTASSLTNVDLISFSNIQYNQINIQRNTLQGKVNNCIGMLTQSTTSTASKPFITISDNAVLDCRTGIYFSSTAAICSNSLYTLSITGNTIIPFATGVSLGFSGSTPFSMKCNHIIEGNTFVNATYGINVRFYRTADSTGTYSLKRNNFVNNGVAISNTGNTALPATNSYWNGLSQLASIKALITDTSGTTPLISPVRLSLDAVSPDVFIDSATLSERYTFPYGVEVRSTITVSAGAQIKLGEGTNLLISGALIALGTLGNPITFGSTSGKFGSIIFSKDATATVLNNDQYQSGSILRNVIIQNGGNNAKAVVNSEAFLLLDNVQVSNSNIAFNSSSSVYIWNSKFNNIVSGIQITGTDKNIQFIGNTISTATDRAVSISGGTGQIVFNDNTFVTGKYGTKFNLLADTTVSIRNNTWKAFTTNAVEITGTNQYTVHFEQNKITGTSGTALSVYKSSSQQDTISDNVVSGYSSSNLINIEVNGGCSVPLVMERNNILQNNIISSNANSALIQLTSSGCNGVNGIELRYNKVDQTTVQNTTSSIVSVTGNSVNIHHNLFNYQSAATLYPWFIHWNSASTGQVLHVENNWWGIRDYNELQAKMFGSNSIQFTPYLFDNSVDAVAGKQCLVNYSTDCTLPLCFSRNSSDPSVCSSHGQCVSPDVCNCLGGFLGTNCQIAVAASPSPVAESSVVPVTPVQSSDFVIPEETLPVAPSIDVAQSSHVTIPEESGPIVYESIPETIASPSLVPEASPSIWYCFGRASDLPTVCSGHGSCTTTDTCYCEPGYSGTACEIIRTCNGIHFVNSTVCSSHGVCSDENTCDCYSGYTGQYCGALSVTPITCTFDSNNVEGTVFNRLKVLSVTANVAPVNKISNMEMQWVLYNNGGSTINLTPLLLRPSSPYNTRTILLNQGSLKSNSVYSLVFMVRYKGDTVYTRFSKSIQTSRPPTAGTFSINPSKGFALNTTFTYNVTGWKSGDGEPITYAFGYVDKENKHVLSSFSTKTSFQTTLPAGNYQVFVIGQSGSGDQITLTQNVTVTVVSQTAIVQTIFKETEPDILVVLPDEEYQTKIATLTASVDSSIQYMEKQEVLKVIDNVFSAMTLKSVAQKQQELIFAQVQSIKTLTSNIIYVSQKAAMQAVDLLSQALKYKLEIANADYNGLITITEATDHLSQSMLENESDTPDKQAFTSLLDSLLDKSREFMVDSQEQQTTMNNVAATVVRKSNDATIPLKPKVNIPRRTRSRSLVDNTDVIEVEVSQSIYSNPSIEESGSIFIQITAYSNPIENSTHYIVSPVVRVQVFNETQGPIEQSDVPLFNSSIPVTAQRNATTDYTCRYWNDQVSQWMNDTTVCNKVYSDEYVVKCECTQPVAHTVTLDYIQAVKEEDNENVPQSSNINNKRKLSAGAIVGIVIGCSVLILLALIILLVTLPLCVMQHKKYASRSKNDIEMIDNNA